MKASLTKYIQVALFTMCNLYVNFAYSQSRTEHEIDSIGLSFVEKMQNETENDNLTYHLAVKSSELLSDTSLVMEWFFVYNLVDKAAKDNSKGFFIVSTDKSVPALIGYSETSTFDKTNVPPAFKYWLGTFCRNDISSIQKNTRPFTESETKEVAPLLDGTQWGQGTPFNNDCPTNGFNHCLAGCVATAMAQVMKFYEYPDCGRGTIKYTTSTDKIVVEKNLDECNFSWNDMIPSYNEGYTEEQANAVATLMSCCGASVNMDYGVEASGAYQYDLLSAYLNYFNYDKDAAFMMRDFCSEEDWHSLLIKELDAGHPVNYAGQSRKDGGHSFVIDGYKSSTTASRPYYHINWGWQGQCDGYYQIAELHPNENGLYATENGFNETQQMLIGIKPEDSIDEGRNVICTSELELTNNELYSGESTTLSIADIYNFSLDSFDGKLIAVLVDSNNVEKQIGSISLYVKYMNSASNQSMRINIPDSTATGEYTLQLRSIKSGSNVASKVYSTSYPTIHINHTTTPTFASKLSAVELESAKNEEDDKEIRVNAYIVTNRSEESFNGQLQMTITDGVYNSLVTFGSFVTLQDLDYMEFLSDPITFYGYIPSDITNGEYYLCLVSKHTNEEDWKLVSYYDDLIEQTEEKVLSLPMVVENDIVTIGNQIYSRGNNTAIRKISSVQNFELADGCVVIKSGDEPQTVRIYDYMGKLVSKKETVPNSDTQIRLPKGIYILSINGNIMKIAL